MIGTLMEIRDAGGSHQMFRIKAFCEGEPNERW